MPISLDFHTVQSTKLTAFCRRAVGFNNATNIGFLHNFRKTAMHLFPHTRRSDNRQPVPGIGNTSTPQVCDLTHQCRTVFVYAVRHFLKERNDFVISCIQIPKHRRRIRSNQS